MNSEDADEDETPHGITQHGIAGGYYRHIGGGMYMANLICICSFTAQGDSWEEAGSSLDDHLAEECGDWPEAY